MGDVILSVNGVKIETVKGLAEIAAHQVPQWHLTIRRGDQVINTVLGG
jgi:hypothetical protein